MSFYQRAVLPTLLHLAMRMKALRSYRERVIGAAEGLVLEIGIGSGLNLPLYGANASRVIGLDPSPALLRLARREARAARVPISFLEGTAEALAIESNSIDTVVTTWTLCTIPDAGRALRECRRVLRPAGRLLFAEHGRAPESSVARWQDRLDPLWWRIAGGCHLNRQIDALIADAGFRIEALRNSRIPGVPTHNFFYEGHARPL